MLASNNSAKGISDVFHSIIKQTGLEKSEFHERLQVVEGDLGTCLFIESLRAIRRPSSYAQSDISNCFTVLGAAHVMWNIAQAIFLMHFGDNHNSKDLGAWHMLSALGLPSDRTTSKKDYNLMIANMTKVHKATILHCLQTVMGSNDLPKPDAKRPMRTADIEEIIELCHLQFFSPKAMREAQASKNQKLINLMLRLQDFASVVECDWATRAGDVGRLLNVWRRWAVMAQGMPGLTQYAIHLPRTIMLLTSVLPPGLQKVLQHSILVSPSGRSNHFVPKDLFLEVQNYWLKYFYNHNGIGSDITRIQDVISINVPLVSIT
ncbi:hypothetical protein PTTG_07503 [Puccinia triticina 1-1 BBBD Race 1]|uniref:DUF6589 domain-containing protein n=1 Tax=Puccinia triticina (isolate 1-1 / race 1 (BBBD)) TaxID=630390 RepID=A0A0C4F329_PUCT1|nr:hypothetical protein PTTG_07503 [Puccinia triticina 1-1 BBBD Race 1]